MATNLRELVCDLSIGDPIAYEKVRIVPLRMKTPSDLEYLTLDDACSETLVTVEEASTSGSVPELRVRNHSKQRVLIPDGSTLVGAKQNRVVNLSVMLAPETETVIPVSCLERGRWRFMIPHGNPSWFCDSVLRSQMCADTTHSLEKISKVSIDQGGVWDHVEAMLGSAGAHSPTRAYHALYEKWQQELGDYEAHLPIPENAGGVAVEIDETLQAVDLFDKRDTLRKLWSRLIRSYLLTALRPEAPRGRETDVKEFLERAISSGGESYEPVGLGTTIRLSNAEAVGAALVCDGQLVHLSVFANGVPKLGGNEPPPAPQENKPASRPKQSNSRRPWWRFWA